MTTATDTEILTALNLRTCIADDCSRPRRRRLYCQMHEYRLRYHGSLANPRPSAEERFWAKVHQGPNCWEWIGAQNGVGYGELSVRGRKVLAHRFAYELLVGPIPDGLTIDHLCRNRACVRPDHLEPVTLAENIRRGNSLRLCSRPGHDIRMRRNGASRFCHTCASAHARRRYAERTRDRATR